MNNNELQSLKIYEDTKESLDKLKVIPKESYDSIIRRLININDLHSKMCLKKVTK